MGTYIYGIAKKSINVGELTVHHAFYITKPSWGWEDDNTKAKRICTRIQNQWEGKEIPRYIALDFKEGSEVHDFHSRRDLRRNRATNELEEHKIYPTPTFYDDPFGFGKVVGHLKKVGRRWVLVPVSAKVEQNA